MLTPSDVRDAVDHMPPAAVFALDGISWDDYERISGELGEGRGFRVTYDHGRLEIVTTSSVHESWNMTIRDAVYILCEERGLPLEAYGGTTWTK